MCGHWSQKWTVGKCRNSPKRFDEYWGRPQTQCMVHQRRKAFQWKIPTPNGRIPTENFEPLGARSAHCLFSRVQRGGQLSAKLARPFTSYRQPARPPSETHLRRRCQVVFTIDQKEYGSLPGAPISATFSVAAAPPRQFAFLQIVQS